MLITEQALLTTFRKCKEITVKVFGNLLVFTCVMAVVLGIIIGLSLNTFDDLLDEEELYISIPIDVLTHMIKGVSIPLIVSSIILGICSFKFTPSTKAPWCSVIYFLSTALVSVTIGLVLVVFLKPGVTDDMEDQKGFFTSDTFLVFYMNVFPDSVVRSLVKHYKLERREFDIPEVTGNSGVTVNITQVVLEGHYDYGLDIIGIIFWSLLTGAVFNWMEERSIVLVDIVYVIYKISVEFYSYSRRYLPIAVLFMTIYHVVDTHDLELGFQMGKFIAVVAIGLIMHGAIVLPLFYLVFMQQNPYTFIQELFPALRAAFLLNSRQDTRKATVSCLKKRNGKETVLDFMMVVRTSLNMNGTVLYEAAAAAFIAQLNDIYLDFNLLFTIGVTAAALSFLGSGIPPCGVIFSLFILNGANLPLKDVWILVAVEWILNPPVSAINVLGDCIGFSIIQKLATGERGMPGQDHKSARFLNKLHH